MIARASLSAAGFFPTVSASTSVPTLSSRGSGYLNVGDLSCQSCRRDELELHAPRVGGGVGPLSAATFRPSRQLRLIFACAPSVRWAAGETLSLSLCFQSHTPDLRPPAAVRCFLDTHASRHDCRIHREPPSSSHSVPAQPGLLRHSTAPRRSSNDLRKIGRVIVLQAAPALVEGDRLPVLRYRGGDFTFPGGRQH